MVVACPFEFQTQEIDQPLYCTYLRGQYQGLSSILQRRPHYGRNCRAPLSWSSSTRRARRLTAPRGPQERGEAFGDARIAEVGSKGAGSWRRTSLAAPLRTSSRREFRLAGLREQGGGRARAAALFKVTNRSRCRGARSGRVLRRGGSWSIPPSQVGALKERARPAPPPGPHAGHQSRGCARGPYA